MSYPLQLHSLRFDIQTRSLDPAPWLDRLYFSNDLTDVLGERHALRLDVEQTGSSHALPLTPLRDAVFAENQLCFGRCYYGGNRFWSVAAGDYAHELEYDVAAHRVRANVGGRYAQDGAVLVSSFIRSVAQSFLLPFYGLKTVHGAVVCRDDRAFLLCGPGGAGKTTTAIRLMQEGFAVLSDDAPFFAMQCGNAVALSSLDYLHVSDATLALFPELRPHVVGGRDHKQKWSVPVAAMRAAECRRPHRITHIIRLQRGAVSSPSLVALDKRAEHRAMCAENMVVFRAAAFHSPLFHTYTAFVLELLSSIIRNAEVYCLEFADHHLDAVADLIAGLAAHRPGSA